LNRISKLVGTPRRLAGKPVFSPSPLVANPLRGAAPPTAPSAAGESLDDDDDDDGAPRYAPSRHHRVGGSSTDVELRPARGTNDLEALVARGTDTAL